MVDEIKVGAEIEVAHPFIREEYHGFDEDGPFKRMSWRPGTRVEPIYPDDAEEVADGIGTQILTIVSIHKPGRFPSRVFFTRRWRDPDGREFGKTKCHIKTLQAFRRRCRSFGYEFRLATPVLVT
ncbi:hypothetical protein [Bradyrhizobium sp.]